MRVLGLRLVTAGCTVADTALNWRVSFLSILWSRYVIPWMSNWNKNTDEARGNQQHGKQTTNRVSRHLETSNRFN